MKLLDNITIINANCVDAKTSVKVLNYCSKNIKFGKKILFTNDKPSNLTNDIQFIKIKKINNIKDYNEFIIKNLPDHIDTDFCLITQNDGFIINPHLWDDNFLKYDYIGAPWSMEGMKIWKRTNRIGNGGFSLRSKKLIKYIQSFKYVDFNEPEDVITSLVIEKHNDKFIYPTIDIAIKFSIECPIEDYDINIRQSFGFHGKEIYNNLNILYPELFRH